MSGMGTSSQNSSQTSQSNPWAPSQPMLNNILGGLGSQFGNYNTNPQEQQALQQWQQNAGNLQNFTGQATNLANSFTGGDPTGLLSPAYQQLQKTLNPIANASLDPTQTPGIQNLLHTIQNDVGNSVNSQFAGAGRDMSGMNQQSLARGLSQGEAQPLLNQYNQNVQNAQGAAGGLLAGAGATSGAMTGNMTSGLGIASALPQFASQGPQAELQAQQAGRQLPLQNLGMLENLTVPIGGLGGQSSGSGSQQNTASPLTQFMQMGGGFNQFMNPFSNGSGGAGNFLKFLGFGG